ncbi:MAG TPA: ATPase [Acidobacteria bacterium]|nr:ATPase [Acidobacteriota bacterium]
MSSSRAEAIFCGVDIGASATKLVLIGDQGHVLARVVRHSGVDYAATAETCLGEALEQAGVERRHIAGTVSTGYGRQNVAFADAHRTEITCHATGCFSLIGRAMTIIDIGGQDNKIIHLDEQGRRRSFKMNRKCAAGTGAFIEEIALRLGLDVSQLDPLAEQAERSVKLGSFCTVFAKTEILAHLRQGEPVEGIIRGAFESVITRVLEMDTLEGEIVATGGVVAHNPMIVRLLAERVGREVTIPPHPQLTGALGAALLAARRSAPAAPSTET